MKLVVVESPAKAKTINKYLGSDFKVVASYGHIRELPSRNGSVLPEEDFCINYEINAKSENHVAGICDLAEKSECIYLATDPDREGEAIAWHVIEVLKARKIIIGVIPFVKRIAFNEITQKAIDDAIEHSRDIDMNLVYSQQARLSLDYLVGFTLSPLLWKKLPGCKSAGRVQSVGLRLIYEREEEILNFKTQEYWDIKVIVRNNDGKTVIAKLIEFDGHKLEKFSVTTESQAENIVKAIKNKQFTVATIEKKQLKRVPAPPFTTSYLQQEAARKLGFSAKKTMIIAQKLYEGIDLEGEATALITYMRTDSVTLSEDAVTETRKFIKKTFGDNYLPRKAREFKTKAKNAQEAHEAIRPVNIMVTPEFLLEKIEPSYLKLYDLIWRRTVACQMENMVLDQVSVYFATENEKHIAKATGTTIAFDGFYRIYEEGKDDAIDEDDSRRLLPNLRQGEVMKTKTILPQQHFTEPPPRYTEATLVKTLEELGIGRPSTYATIISVLQERDYVVLEKKRFIPQNKGKLVTAFLTLFFKKYVEYDFTADLENKLDDIAKGKIGWKDLLRNFWQEFDLNIKEIEKYKIADIIPYLENALFSFLFPSREDGTNPKICSLCKVGILELRLGKYGAFLACRNYPHCNFTCSVATITRSDDDLMETIEDNKSRLLGYSENLKNSIYLKKGPFGWYVQLGEDTIDKINKPKRVAVPSIYEIEKVDLNVAVNLLELPKIIKLNINGYKDVILGIGRYGPYMKYEGIFISIPKGKDPFNLSYDDYEEIIKNLTYKLNNSKKSSNIKNNSK